MTQSKRNREITKHLENLTVLKDLNRVCCQVLIKCAEEEAKDHLSALVYWAHIGIEKEQQKLMELYGLTPTITQAPESPVFAKVMDAPGLHLEVLAVRKPRKKKDVCPEPTIENP